MSSSLFPAELFSRVTSLQENEKKNSPTDRVVILQPITMRIPNSQGVYSLSKLKTKKEVSYKEFLTRYADQPRKIYICFDEAPSSDTILQRAELVTAYGFVRDCWYIRCE